MALTFANPVHVNGGLIFAPQDYVAAPSAFAGVAVASALRWRGRFAGVAADDNGLLFNASDPDGDPLSYRIVTSVSNGTLTAYLGGAFTYVPNAGFVGFDSFTYQVFAGGEGSNPATVTLSVEGAFAGVAIAGRMRLLTPPATLALGATLQAVGSTLRLRSAPGAGAMGSAFAVTGATSRLRLLSAPAALSTDVAFAGVAATSRVRVLGSVAALAMLSTTDFQAVSGAFRLRSAVAALDTQGPVIARYLIDAPIDFNEVLQ